MVSHSSWGFHWLTKKYVCHSLLLQPYCLYSDKLPLCKIHLAGPAVQWESHGHRIIKFWKILGQSGSPVLMYAECEQVGLIDHVHPGVYVPGAVVSIFVLSGVCPFKSGENKNFMSFTVQFLTFPCVSLNLFLFSSNDGSAHPLLPPRVSLPSSPPFIDLYIVAS